MKTDPFVLGVITAAVVAATGAQAQSLTSTDAEARARAHIAAFPGRSLDAPGHSYELRGRVTDADGSEHVRFDRRFQGLRVIGGDLVVHAAPNGSLRDMSRTLNRQILLSTRATAAEGLVTAAALAGRSGYSLAGTPERVVYARGAAPVLAFDVRVTGARADGTPSELHVIVDAHRATVLEAWDDVQTEAANGTGQSLYSGTVPLVTDFANGTYTLRDPGRGAQYTIDMKNRQFGRGAVFTDADNLWGDGTSTSRQSAGVDAQYGTAVTWDYYKNVHGRTGIADDGRGAYNRVHYGRNYANAYWSDSCFCMTYGDGDGRNFTALVSLDVAGHEMTHGVTSRTAALVYSGESGGLNEGTSDIFGSMVEFYANNPNDPGDYLIGEKVSVTGVPLRTMIQPSTDGRSSDCWYSGVGTLDVHYSSGVANHFFYLLAEGTANGAPSKTCTATDTRVASGAGTVAGITRQKAEKIWYRALTVYMTSSTDFAGARAASLQAAGDLYGPSSAEAAAVAAAWSAVGVN